MLEDKIRDYAKMLLICGINLEKDQELIISATTEIDYFCEILTEEAYQIGAKNVEVLYFDDKITKLRYQYANTDTYADFEQNKYGRIMEYAKKGACVINLLSSNPFAFIDVDSERLKKGTESKKNALKEYLSSFMKGEFRSVMAAVPGKDWAKDLFPNESNPIDKMWESILKCCHSDGQNAVDGWTRHGKTLLERSEKLTHMNIKSMHFESCNGTDLKLELCDDAVWGTAYFADKSGARYWCNIPTEEVGAVPHKNKVNGKAVATLPLFYNGNMIDHFEIEFKNGEVINYKAEKGYEALKGIIETDQGSKRLGEVALVPFSSTVNQTGIIYKTTLFDENARCHLALGAGYPIGVGGEDRSFETLIGKGLNVSSTHVDFMFGSQDMKCTGTTHDGKKIVIMENGEIVL
jgi:aminopeptidase